MTDWPFLPERIRTRLQGLPPTHLVAFAATVCERLLPNYTAWSARESWGDPSVLRRVLDQVWAALGGATLETAEIQQLIEQVAAVGPDSEDFADCSAAIDAVAAIATCLEAVLGHTLERAADVGSSAGETIDAAFQGHPDAMNARLAAELRQQAAEIGLLREAPEVSPAILALLRQGATLGGGALLSMSRGPSIEPGAPRDQ